MILIPKTICDYLSITVDVLYRLFEYVEREARQDKYLNGDKLEKIFDEFIIEHLPDTQIDEILFFHLGRRLNSVGDCNRGNNLFDLLSTQNEMTLFLKKHDVEFSIYDRHLELIYKGEKISLENISQEHIPYLRWRLGYNSKRVDFCFNGFALKDLLYRNNYARELYDVPEFVGVLATFLKRKDISIDYFDNSKYYCFEYCIPLQKVIFDEEDNLTEEQKVKYLLNQILNRLYGYHTHDIRYMFDHENPVIRLTDRDTMEEQYYIGKEEVTRDMLE